MSAHTLPPQGVLLDIDGTLLDSNLQHAKAWADALAEDDVVVHARDLLRRIGKGGDKILPEVARVDPESERGRAILARRKVLFREKYLSTCQAFPGARALVLRMKEAGLTIAVATSASSEELAAFLHVAGVHDLIETATTSSDAPRSKPDPDIVAAAALKTGLPAGVLVMLGDTPYDVEAAAGAGIRAVALRCGGWDEPDLSGAVAVYDGPADLLAHYDESPFGRARPDASARTRRHAESRRGP